MEGIDESRFTKYRANEESNIGRYGLEGRLQFKSRISLKNVVWTVVTRIRELV